jgi:hypothetical protein
MYIYFCIVGFSLCSNNYAPGVTIQRGRVYSRLIMDSAFVLYTLDDIIYNVFCIVCFSLCSNNYAPDVTIQRGRVYSRLIMDSAFATREAGGELVCSFSYNGVTDTDDCHLELFSKLVSFNTLLVYVFIFQINLHVRTHIHPSAYTYKRKHTHTLMYTHTRAHTCTRTSSSPSPYTHM